MSCTLPPDLLQAAISFHGHECPGFTIGIRAAELARTRLALHEAKAPLCVTETDMCAVDAIQFLTQCTFGKGNLIHRDFGKTAFTFFNRDTGEGFRAVFQDNIPGAGPDMEKAERIRGLMAASLDDLFRVEPVESSPVRAARILRSICCDSCAEMTMESRIRLFDGQHLCFPCFQRVEQKI